MNHSKSASGLGFYPENADIQVINRTGSTLPIGSLVQLDFMQSDTDTTNTTLGSPNSIWANAILPTHTPQMSRVYAITLATCGDNAYVQARLRGTVLARVAAAATIGAGDGMLVPKVNSPILVCETTEANLILRAGSLASQGSLGFNLDSLTSNSDAVKQIVFDGTTLSDGRFVSTPNDGAQVKMWQHDIGSAAPVTASAIGTPVTFDLETTGVSTVTSVVANSTAMEQHQTNTTAGDASGRITSAAVIKGSTNPTLTIRMQTGANIQNVGLWWGLTDTSLKAVDTPTTELVAAFRYDTAVPDTTGFWHTVTNDGVTLVVTTTTAAIAVSTFYELKIEWNNTLAAVFFYINGVLVATHTTGIPDSATGLHIEHVVTTKTTALKRMAWGTTRLTHG